MIPVVQLRFYSLINLLKTQIYKYYVEMSAHYIYIFEKHDFAYITW